MSKLAKMPSDAKEAIADAVLQGRFRYAARIIFQWADVMTKRDEMTIKDDIESYSGYPVDWVWAQQNVVLTIRYKGETYPYRQQDVTSERW